MKLDPIIIVKPKSKRQMQVPLGPMPQKSLIRTVQGYKGQLFKDLLQIGQLTSTYLGLAADLKSGINFFWA